MKHKSAIIVLIDALPGHVDRHAIVSVVGNGRQIQHIDNDDGGILYALAEKLGYTITLRKNHSNHTD